MPRQDAMPNSRQIRLFVALAATALGLYLCYRFALPFLSALTWALVLAIALTPMHQRIERRVGRANPAALISVTLAMVAVAVPVLFVAQQLVREAANGAVFLENAIRNIGAALADYPGVAGVASWIEERLDPAGALGALAQWLTGQSTALLRGSLNQVVNFVLTFYLLFYFLRDKDQALRSIEGLSPVAPDETAYVIARFVDTVHATLIGTMIVAAVQGVLGGLMFWWLDLPTPVFWGMVMGLLAIVPVLGAFVVWVPAAIFLALDGAWVSAVILSLWGGIIVASIDNLLYPMLVGNRLKLHTVVAFVGAVGGIILFGASGLVLGPAVIAVTFAFIEILKRRFVQMHDPDAISQSEGRIETSKN